MLIHNLFENKKQVNEDAPGQGAKPADTLDTMKAGAGIIADKLVSAGTKARDAVGGVMDMIPRPFDEKTYADSVVAKPKSKKVNEDTEPSVGDTVNVTTRKGRTYTGELMRMDDNSVALRVYAAGGIPHAQNDSELRSQIIIFKKDHVVSIDSELDEDLPPPENARKTQIASTLGTYKKAGAMLDKMGVQGKSLDFGAGLGKGTAELGKDAESYEPYPREDFKPHYIDATKIPSNSYSRIVNLNVLNVVPNVEGHRIRDEIVRQIGRVLAPDGVALITTRGRDVLTIKGTPGEEPMSMVSSIGTYQKGFTNAELKEYVQSILGDNFEVSSAKLGPAGVMIKKLSQSLDEAVGCNMTEDGRECDLHGIMECPGYSNLMGEAFKMPPESVQDKMHRRHQELRKKRGAPDPAYYKEFAQSYDIEDDKERYAKQAEIKKKYKIAESLRDGEYHTWTVHFDDGTSQQVNVPSDEFDVRGYFARRGKKVVKVDYSFAVQGDRHNKAGRDPAGDAQERRDRDTRAHVQHDRDLTETDSDMIRFSVETERAYQAVMDRFGDVVEWSGDDMMVPAKIWPRLEQVAFDADGIGAEQEYDNAQARDAFGSMFGGGNPANTLGIRKEGVAEGNEFDRMMGNITSSESLNAREALELMTELIHQAGASYKEALQQASVSFDIAPAELHKLYKEHSSRIAEDRDSEELANEVYAEFERMYPKLASRTHERTVHAAIMDVLNYGDGDISALAQDVARAVKRDIQQGVAGTREVNVNDMFKEDGSDAKSYMQTDRGAVPPKTATDKPMDSKPAQEPNTKKDPKDYLIKNEQVQQYNPKGVPIKTAQAAPAPLNVPQGWEAKTQADGSTRISKQGSMSSAEYKQNMADYKAKNWTPEKMADYGQRMASGQGYTDAERSANYQQQQKSFGTYADQPLQGVDEEQLDELSPKTLMSYSDKAYSDAKDRLTQVKAGAPNKKELVSKAEKRVGGIKQAHGKVKAAKGTVEEITEEIEQYLEELDRAGYGIVNEKKKTKQRLDPSCWSGYHKEGTKVKGDTRVNNCVKNEGVIPLATKSTARNPVAMAAAKKSIAAASANAVDTGRTGKGNILSTSTTRG